MMFFSVGSAHHHGNGRLKIGVHFAGNHVVRIRGPNLCTAG
jgi:hypothetical protein